MVKTLDSDGGMASELRVYTIGHSTHSLDSFASLLKRYEIDVLVDVRSCPYSRHVPQFNADNLREFLAAIGIRYVFLGDALGGRPRDRELYDEHGHIVYARIARRPAFRRGLSKLEKQAETCRVAVLCSEEDPVHCHRRLLVGNALMEQGIKVTHIRGDGRLQTEEALMGSEKHTDSSMHQLKLLDV